MGSLFSSSKSTYVPSGNAQFGMIQDRASRLYKTPEELTNRDLSKEREMFGKNAELTALESRNLERRLNPERAAMRERMDKDLASKYEASQRGELDPAVQNALAKAGLSQMFQGGTTGGSSGIATVQTVYGKGSTDYINALQNQMMAYLDRNGQPRADLTPEEIANYHLTVDKMNVAQRNARAQQLAQGDIGASSQASSLMQKYEDEMNQRLAAAEAERGSKQGQMLGMLGSIGGAAAGSMFGPIGTALGSSIGGSIAGSLARKPAAPPPVRNISTDYMFTKTDTSPRSFQLK